MAIQVQLRRGTTAQNNAFTGAVGEVTVDTDKDTAVVHDGATAGGFPLVGEKGTQTITGVKTFSSSVLTTTDINGGTIDGTAIGGASAAAGAFTTLSASGVTTVQAGTNSAPAITTTGDTNTGIFFPAADQVAVATNGVERVNLGNSATVFNDGGADVDFRVEGDTEANLLFVDASADAIGMGTNTPTQISGGRVVEIRNTKTTATSADNQDFIVRSDSRFAIVTVIGASTGGSNLDFGDENSNNVGAVQYNHPDNYMNFKTNGSDRMRITSDGDLCVGRTSTIAGARMAVQGSVSDMLVRFANTSSVTPSGLDVQYSNAAPNDSGNWFFLARDTSANRFYVMSNGGIANYDGNNSGLSDRREKTNFAPAKSYLQTICAIPVQTFNYIDQNHEEDPGLTLGVVAQDVQAVAPELVTESDWSAEKDGSKMRLSIYQTDMQYALMKCIQELKAELDTVKAELATLKGN
jgi:hypothetical protein